MNLFDYFCKNVVLQDCDGTVWHGYVDTFIPAIDSEDEEDEISLITNKGYICFHE